MPTTRTFEFAAHNRDRRNAKRDRTDADLLALVRQAWPTPPLTTPEQVAAAIADERASEAAQRVRAAQTAAEVAVGCLWADALAEFGPQALLGADDTVTVTVTVTDLIATATITVPDPTDTDTQER